MNLHRFIFSLILAPDRQNLNRVAHPHYLAVSDCSDQDPAADCPRVLDSMAEGAESGAVNQARPT